MKKTNKAVVITGLGNNLGASAIEKILKEQYKDSDKAVGYDEAKSSRDITGLSPKLIIIDEYSPRK